MNSRIGSALAQPDHADPLLGSYSLNTGPIKQQARAGLDRNDGDARLGRASHGVRSNCGQVDKARLFGLSRLGQHQRAVLLADQSRRAQVGDPPQQTVGPTGVFRRDGPVGRFPARGSRAVR